MFDHQQFYPHYSDHQIRPHLRPDLMRLEHIERLRHRDTEIRAGFWRSAWKSIMNLAERLATFSGTALLRWANERKLRLQMERSPTGDGA